MDAAPFDPPLQETLAVTEQLGTKTGGSVMVQQVAVVWAFTVEDVADYMLLVDLLYKVVVEALMVVTVVMVDKVKVVKLVMDIVLVV